MGRELELKIVVTGAAGFIGAALSQRLVGDGNEVIGIDNLSAYYDVRLKDARLARNRSPLFKFYKASAKPNENLGAYHRRIGPNVIIAHLKSQTATADLMENTFPTDCVID